MNDREIVKYLNGLSAGLALLAPERKYAFGLLCCERLYAIYERASVGHVWARPEILRSALEKAWAQVERAGTGESDVGASCRSATPPESEPSGVEVAVARFVACAIADFLSEAGFGRPEYARYVAARCLDVIDMYQDESGAAVDALMAAECARQQADLQRVRSAESLEAGPLLQAQAGQQALLGDAWFV